MNEKPSIYAVIVAAGSGQRAGGAVPKQYAPVAGRPMLLHSIETLLAHPAIAGVQVVIAAGHEGWYEAALETCTCLHRQALLPPVHGGEERADSVLAGLAALMPHHPDYVLVHDAARPCLPASLLDRLVAALVPEAGVVPVLAIADTVRRFSAGRWEEISREGLLRMQTPQAFPFAALHALYAAPVQGANWSDEAARWLAAGRELRYVEGDARAHKITSARELETAMGHHRTAIGMGYDVHVLMPAGAHRHIRLGGIDIAHDQRLEGHSDADVVLHALTDALLGALAEGDIGTHFPPGDARWQGADSARFVEYTRDKVRARGGDIQHVDVTVICERPKIGPHREAIRARIAALLQLPEIRVSVKATTTEKLGFTGRAEGIAAQAIATLTLPEAA